MEANVSSFREFIKNYEIINTGQKLVAYIKEYNFVYAGEKLNLSEDPSIQANLQKTKALLIRKYQNESQKQTYNGYILSFEHTIIIVDKLSEEVFKELLLINPKLSFLFFPYQKNATNETYFKNLQFIIPHKEFDEEVGEMSKSINMNAFKNTEICSLFMNIRRCIAGYLIQKSYQKLNKNRLEEQDSDQQNSDLFNNIRESDYIELRQVGIGSTFFVNLIYHIEQEELFVIKKPNTQSNEKQKLIERVCNNCPSLDYPFLPKFYGKVKYTDYLVMEFIYGKHLNLINIDEFNDNDIYTIIFELIISIKYLHNNHFIFRDLKPDNVTIDQNKTSKIFLTV